MRNDDTAIIVPEPMMTTPEGDAAKLRALSLVTQARDIVVKDQESLADANLGLVLIKETRKSIDAEFDPNIARWHEGHKAAVAAKRKWTDTLDEAERELKPKIANYLIAVDRERLAASRAAFLTKDAAKREAEQASDKAVEMVREGRLDEAEALVVESHTKAEAAIAKADDAVPPKPETENISLRSVWTFEIEDESVIPRAFMMPNEKRIRSYVKAMKEQGIIPGVRIFAEPDVAVRVKK